MTSRPSPEVQNLATIAASQAVVLSLDSIRPYPNNPRKIPPEAVAAVRSSIEKYGYRQPIVVDKDHVIIVGHTRHQALLQMGVTEVPVYVADLTPEQAAAYRLADNRTGEGSEWESEALVMELREWRDELREEFFPDVDLEINTINAALGEVTDADTRQAAEDVGAMKEQRALLTTKVICPACYVPFDVRTDTLPGLSAIDLEQLGAAADGDSRAG